VLGYINPTYFLGGKMKLYPELAKNAIKKKVAEMAETDIITAAAGMYDLININMANGIREATIAKGLDPREFPLICAGGAGPVHACAIALELEMSTIIVPRESSVFCATGMLISDLRHDFVRTYRTPLVNADKDKFNELFKEMEEEGNRILRLEMKQEKSVKFDYSLDLRYMGEYYEINTPITFEERGGMLVESISDKFHALHDKLYGYQLKEISRPIELINLRLIAWGITPKPKFKEEQYAGSDSSTAIKGKREIYLTKEKSWINVNTYDGLKLRYGNKIVGPAIIELPTTTILILPDFNMLCDKFGNYTLYLPEKEEEIKQRLEIGK
jgi:N-methylhydantoinase A